MQIYKIFLNLIKKDRKIIFYSKIKRIVNKILQNICKNQVYIEGNKNIEVNLYFLTYIIFQGKEIDDILVKTNTYYSILLYSHIVLFNVAI